METLAHGAGVEGKHGTLWIDGIKIGDIEIYLSPTEAQQIMSILAAEHKKENKDVE